jgi:secreted trypsin-like serine protease
MTFFDNTWVLVGITSNGIGCAQAGYSGIYTRVSFYIPFIQNIVNNTGVTVRSTLRTTPLTSASTVTVTIQKTSNRAGNSKSFLGESISFFILWLLVIINV